MDWSATGAAMLNAVIYPIAIVAARRFRVEGSIKRVELTGADLAWRAGLVTFCVILVTAASSSIGSYFSGVFAFFPVAMGSFFIILHPRIGGPAAASVAAHVLMPLIRAGLGFARRAPIGSAARGVVVLRDRSVHWRPALARAGMAGR